MQGYTKQSEREIDELILVRSKAPDDRRMGGVALWKSPYARLRNGRGEQYGLGKSREEPLCKFGTVTQRGGEEGSDCACVAVAQCAANYADLQLK
uniref:Uncharacterized protein n=1 Tax=Melanopsichium pennsylvanicum 4 TaxID=1398559 RepID=A0A077R7X7_9BASI|nr:uncharacterized protein BN887_06197 [Melanopsichium pennsylvanicum 4]